MTTKTTKTTTSSKRGILFAVVALGGVLTGCGGGAYDTTIVRLDGARGASAQAGATGSSGAYAAQPTAEQGQAYAAAPAYAAAQVAPAPAPDANAYSNSYTPPPAPAPMVDGRGNVAPADPFARTPPAATDLRPMIARVSPQDGALEGGNEMLITGSDFSNVQVIVNGQLAQVTSQSSNAVTVVVPEGQPGPATVVVTNRDGSYSVAGGAYRYM